MEHCLQWLLQLKLQLLVYRHYPPLSIVQILTVVQQPLQLISKWLELQIFWLQLLEYLWLSLRVSLRVTVFSVQHFEKSFVQISLEQVHQYFCQAIWIWNARQFQMLQVFQVHWIFQSPQQDFSLHHWVSWTQILLEIQRPAEKIIQVNVHLFC